MKKHLGNAAYGVLDYISYPLGMLLVAPVVLHKLGASEYGLWAISTAVISVGGILASGFCDANIQRVAKLRHSTETGDLAQTVRSMLGINLSLGAAFALVTWIAAPAASLRIEAAHPERMSECLAVLRMASVLILVRALETVGVSTQRAFEEYGFSARVNALVRFLTLGSAAGLAVMGFGVRSFLVETGIFLAVGTVLQMRRARQLLAGAALWPVLHRVETRALLRVGVFAWIVALGGVVFNQCDRLLLGVVLGAAAVAPYTLCVQLAHPIFGLTASGLQFLFPYLSSRVEVVSPAELRRTLLRVFGCNVALVLCGAAGVLAFGRWVILRWAGTAVAHAAEPLLPKIVLSATLMGMTVTGSYALMALEQFKTIAWISLSSRGLLLLLMAFLVNHGGVGGIASARVAYGIFSLVLYGPLLWRLAKRAGSVRAPGIVAGGMEVSES